MSEPWLVDRTVEVIRDALQVEVPTPETDLVDAGLIDSLALITLISELELEFGVRMPLDEFDLARFRSAAQMAAVVAGLASDRRAA